jgi:CDP-diacylglycerol--glycerol-3-phosphate 3-phosphatidyltransferase
LLLILYDPNDPGRAGFALGLLLILIATDVGDGWLARRYGQASKFGYVLDGLGDRSVQVVTYLLLLTAGVLSIFIVWALIFREICQYAIRLLEPEWYVSQSPLDRKITRSYLLASHGALIAELSRVIAAPGPPSGYYVTAVNVTLAVAAVAAYSRILPRLSRAWRDATGPTR